METKKLLKFLLNDLSELEELVTEKRDTRFDDFELEFIKSRVGGAKRMVQILYDRESSVQKEIIGNPVKSYQQIEKIEVQDVNETKVEEIVEERTVKAVAEENTEVIAKNDKKEPLIVEEKVEKKEGFDSQKVWENVITKAEEIKEENKNDSEEEKKSLTDEDSLADETKEQKVAEEGKKHELASEKEEVELDEEKEDEVKAGQRLGDSFSKEKSLNDLINVDNTKLEHKLSNRPVTSIKSAIGINDRFQYIRELFDGNADTFAKAVSELDAKNNIQEAVVYLQQNFKWKKNETSLKFVNLVKRRFLNE